ncbi:MAG: hypothetical protein LBU69_03495, partial [Deltaproteobacteria bacterium]|jgi:hypothetical protein|nr:hypothetical protein [Deltaproteobacteria bacterium]
VVGLRDRFGFIEPKTGETYAWDPGLPSEYQVIQAMIQSRPDLDELVISNNGKEIARRKVSGASRASVNLSLSSGTQSLEVEGFKAGQAVASDRAIFLVK